jgi:hypothetical protein
MRPSLLPRSALIVKVEGFGMAKSSLGEFRYNGGRHRKHASASGSNPALGGIKGPARFLQSFFALKFGVVNAGQSAIANALALPIDPNTDRHNGTPTNPYISHYGYPDDKSPDTNSNKLRRGAFGPLDPYSLAISDNVAKANGLIQKKPVYI